MEKISRKGFLKVAAAAAMSGVTAGALAACNSAAFFRHRSASGDAIYTAGTSHRHGHRHRRGEGDHDLQRDRYHRWWSWIPPTRPRASAAWLPPPCRRR
ncbi:MAG: hypothetical protein ACLVJH_05015 [Faecalibacterium prausnitzii]